MRLEHAALQVPDPVAMADWYVKPVPSISRVSCDCLSQQALGSPANLPLAGFLPLRGMNLFLKQHRENQQRKRRNPRQTGRFIGRAPQRGALGRVR